jgi:signal peptidase II
LKKAIIIILTVLALDQWIKIWVKLNFHYGESMVLIPGWFDLQFVENPGMAFGLMLPGQSGKLTLSIFRIIVVTGISIYLIKLIKQKAHWGFITSVSLIVAGAMGNIIDSALYGLIFDKGSMFDPDMQDFTMYFGKAKFSNEGYTKPLLGNVVDMFHFTKEFTWNGKKREIFSPVFNVADSSITAGIISIILFQGKFFPKTAFVDTPVVSSELNTAATDDVHPQTNQHSEEGERINQWPSHDKEEAD